MDYTRFDDAVLMRLIANSKTEALSVLYDRYARLVYGLALQATGEPASAEEVTQDTFLRAWENAATYQSEKGKVSTWLASIARNRSIDLMRRKQARRENTQVSLDELPSFTLQGNENVENEVDLRSKQRAVRRALAKLPEDQRKALALAYFRGMTHEQIAESLGQPLGTVKTRIRLGMQKLRLCLQEEIAGEDQI
jgi:RNA polymerase sigma-70 factor, ECF subfamily